MLGGSRQPKDFRASDLTQAQHDSKAEAAARDYRQQRIADNVKRAHGAELRAAEGKVAAAAVDAEAAAKRKEADDARRQARINSEIENDLLATPSDTPHAYGDS